MRSEPYTSGKLLDVHVPDGLDVQSPDRRTDVPVVLAWHGSGPDERDALAPLAGELAARGVLVLVPDWQSDDVGPGCDQLLASVAFARTEARALGADPERIVLAGWSLGANAAVHLGLHPGAVDGWSPSAFVGLGGSYAGSPFGPDLFAGSAAAPGRRMLLIHGSADTLVPAARSVEAAGRLVGLGWAARLRQVGTDHAGVIGTVYDRVRHRCVPTEDPIRAVVRGVVADLVADVAFASSPHRR